MPIQYITRKGSIDCGHRVMNHAFACNNVHGHTYLYQLCFRFNNVEGIGYAIDFSEIKRIGVQWLLDNLDHGFIANPKDEKVIKCLLDNNMKIWTMCLNGKYEDCNPTVENMAKEIFLAMKTLFHEYKNLCIHKIVLYETPNSFTECDEDSISAKEIHNFNLVHKKEMLDYIKSKGVVSYDKRDIVTEVKPTEETIVCVDAAVKGEDKSAWCATSNSGIVAIFDKEPSEDEINAAYALYLGARVVRKEDTKANVGVTKYIILENNGKDKN